MGLSAMSQSLLVCVSVWGPGGSSTCINTDHENVMQSQEAGGEREEQCRRRKWHRGVRSQMPPKLTSMFPR